MPYKSKEAKREYMRNYMRNKRLKARKEQLRELATAVFPDSDAPDHFHHAGEP